MKWPSWCVGYKAHTLDFCGTLFDEFVARHRADVRIEAGIFLRKLHKRRAGIGGRVERRIGAQQPQRSTQTAPYRSGSGVRVRSRYAAQAAPKALKSRVETGFVAACHSGCH